MNKNHHAKCLLLHGDSFNSSIFTVHFFCFYFFNACALKSRRKCHYTHFYEFVNLLFETGRQENAISNSQTFSTMNMSSLMSLVPVKSSDTVNSYNKVLHCDEMACCIWYGESETVPWVTHLSPAQSLCSFQLYGISTSILTNIDLTFIMSSVTQ